MATIKSKSGKGSKPKPKAKSDPKPKEEGQQRPMLVPQTTEQVFNEIVYQTQQIQGKKAALEDLKDEKKQIEKDIKDLENEITGLDTARDAKLLGLANGNQFLTTVPAKSDTSDLEGRVMNAANIKTPEELRPQASDQEQQPEADTPEEKQNEAETPSTPDDTEPPKEDSESQNPDESDKTETEEAEDDKPKARSRMRKVS